MDDEQSNNPLVDAGNAINERFITPLKRNFIQAQVFSDYDGIVGDASKLDDHLRAYREAKTPEEKKAAENAWYDGRDTVRERMAKLQEKAVALNDLPQSEQEKAMAQAISEGKWATKEVVDAMPEFAAQIGGQAIPLAQGLAGRVIGGAVGGPVGVGVGIGSTAISTFADSKKQNEVGYLMGAMQDLGLNPFDPNDMMDFLGSQTGKKSLQEAVRGGSTRAMGDALMASIAGVGGGKAPTSILGRIGETAKETLLKQVPGAAATEVAGQLAERGTVYQPGSVLAESVGELPGGAVESVGGLMTRDAYNSSVEGEKARILANEKAIEDGKKIVETRAAQLEAEKERTQTPEQLQQEINFKNSLWENPNVNPLAAKEQTALEGTSGAEVAVEDKPNNPIAERFIDKDNRIKQVLPQTWNNMSVEESKASVRSQEVIGGLERNSSNLLANSVKTTGIDPNQTLVDAHDFAVARHAIDVNNAHKKDGFSGMTNEQATAKLQEIAQKQNAPTAMAIANELVKVRQAALGNLVQVGEITPQDASYYRKIYPNSVPFFREGFDPLLPQKGRKPKAFSGKETLRFFEGSKKEIRNVFNTVVQNYEATNRALLNKAVYESVIGELNQNPYLRKYVSVYIPKEGETVDTRQRDIMVIKQHDKTYYLQIHDENLANQLNALQPEQLHDVLQVLSKFTQFMGANYTRRVPFFGVVTGFYDVVEGGINAAKDFGAKHLPSFYKNYAVGLGIAMKEAATGNNPAFVGMMKRGELNVSNEDAAMYQQAIRDGIMTGGPMHARADQQAKNMVAYAKRKAGNPFTQQVVSLFEHIENFNAVSDVAVRFAAYKEALSMGMSRLEAAAKAQNITVNFNRHGSWGRFFGSLYSFVNAGLQGSRRMFNTMFVGKDGKFDPKGFVAFMGASIALQMMVNKYNDAVDPDWEKLKDNDLKRNLVVAMGDGKFLRLPIPWGIRTFSYASHILSRAMLGKDVDFQAKDLASMLGLAVEAYSPLGGGDVVQMLTPTVFDPVVDIARNVNYLGKNIEPEYKHGVFGRENIPVQERYYDDLERTWMGRATIATTDSMAHVGLATISPAQLSYLLNGYLGGAFKFGTQVMGTAENMGKGKALEPIDLPFLSRYYAVTTPEDRMRILETKSQSGELGAIKKFDEKYRQESYFKHKEEDLIFKKLEAMDMSGRAKALESLNESKPLLAQELLNKLQRTEKTANMTLTGLALSKMSSEERLTYIIGKLQEFESGAERESYINKLIRAGALRPDQKDRNSDYNKVIRALSMLQQNENKIDSEFIASLKQKGRTGGIKLRI